MKKRLRLMIGIILLLLAVAVMAIWPEVQKGIKERQMVRGIQNLETGIVRIELSGREYDVPIRYMYGQAIEKHKQWPKAKKERVKVDALTLSLLLPDLRPYYPEDEARWRVRGHGDRVELTVTKPVGSMGWFDSQLQRYLTGQQPGNIERKENIHGLLHFSAGWFDRYFSEDPLDKLSISCDPERHANGESGVRFPSCKAKSNYREGIVLEYYYGRNHLPHWHKIDSGIKAMLDGFEQSAQTVQEKGEI